MRLARFVGLLALAGAMYAQNWDSSGNSQLNGTYYFRQVYYVIDTSAGTGDLAEAVTIYGNIQFDGNGNYSITTSDNAAIIDYSFPTYYNPYGGGTNAYGLFTGSGTYSIAASGYGFIDSPYATGSSSGSTPDAIYGMVSANGIFVGSSTDNTYGYNDMMVAAPVANPLPTASSFTGSWTGAVFDMSSGSAQGALSLMFSLNPDGAGNLNAGAVTGYVSGSSQAYTQANSGLKYAFSNGAAVATFPVNASLMSGQKYFYFSSDGNFMFGGSPIASNTPFDMIVAVKTGSSVSLSGLYYQAGFDNYNGSLDSYFGSYNVIGKGAHQPYLGHQRINYFGSNSVYDYTYNDTISLSGNTYSSPSANFIVGAGGSEVITSGIGPYLGLSVALQAPAPTGTGVFLNPTGVVNSASNAPFTAGIAPGELLTLYGSNLADSTQVAGIPFPTTGLGGVQVSIGGLPAAIYYVSPTQISAIVPYGIQGGNCACVPIQVTNDKGTSNVVTEFVSATAPGVFTQSQNGLGYGSIEHLGIGNPVAAVGSVITDANPAVEGETLAAYLTGLGAVSPSIADGAPGPSGTLSQTSSTITVDFSNSAAPLTPGFSGLAPGFSGLYQLNLTVPTTGITVGPNYLDISGPDSYMSYPLMPIQATPPTTTTASATKPENAIPPKFRRPVKAGPSLRNHQVKKSFSQARTTDNR